MLVAVGYALSPLSWWNDALVNLPLAWLLASAFTRVVPLAFDTMILGCYWLTNLAGFLLMYAGGKKFSRRSEWRRRDTVIFLVLSTIYTVAIYFLAHWRIVRPMF